MDKKLLYDGLDQLGLELRNTSAELVEMKRASHEIIERNMTLEMENQSLREHLRGLNQVTQAPAENVKQGLSRSRMNLEEIYEEDFHVYYDLYGSRRDNDEPCTSRLEVVYHESGR